MKAKQIADALMRAGFGADERARQSMESVIDGELAGQRKPVDKRTIERRKAWRELRGDVGLCAPTYWLSDDTLQNPDTLPAKSVTVAKIRAAVRLANAAPDLLNALEICVNSMVFAHQNHFKVTLKLARSAIAAAKRGAK